MPSSDFRQIADQSQPARTDRLVRAAVSAYCALPRPSRRETAQLEDLVLPLFDTVSTEARRYVAAVLSELPNPPAKLVRKLCEQPVDVAAPLLIRSPALSDIDLLALISRHGIAHARAIARRSDLNPAIANLIRALERKAVAAAPTPPPVSAPVPSPVSLAPAPAASAPVVPAPPAPVPSPETPAMPIARQEQTSEPVDQKAPSAAETVRNRLRTMMLPAAALAPRSALPAEERLPRAPAYLKLRATALTGNQAFFHTALADALEIGFRQAKAIASASSYRDLILAFRALDIDTEGALLLVLATRPKMFAHAEAVRLFVERYELCHREKALEALRGWRAETLADMMAAASAEKSGANGNRPLRETHVRAS